MRGVLKEGKFTDGGELSEAVREPLEKLAAYPLIVQNPARPQGARIVGQFQRAGLEVKVAVQALDADVMKTYVAAGLGIAVIPAFAYSAEHDQLTEPHRTETFLEDHGPWMDRYGPWTERFAVSEQHILTQAERCLRGQSAEMRAAFQRIGERPAPRG